MFRILVSDPLSPAGLERLRAAPDVHVDAPGKVGRERLLEIIGDYDALIIRSGTRVDAEVLDRARRLKVIGRAGIGLDNVDLERATARGILVMNTPQANVIATAEQTMALILALCRHLPQAHASLARGEWDRQRFLGIQLYHKRLGIIGFGRIGRQVAARAQAFGMEVVAYDPYISEEVALDMKVRVVTLEELLQTADIITVHTTLTPETRGMIGREEIAMMKPGVRLVNCARGGIIDETALYEALRSGHVAGAALDVYSVEPPINNPLIGLPNVVHTPHLGASTVEAQRDVSTQIADQVLKALRGEDYRNAVNLPFVAGPGFARLRPYLELAEKMGRLLALLAPGRIRRIEVEVKGEEIAEQVKPLTIALLKGLLSPFLGEVVNYINAPLLATERGIALSQTRGLETPDYPNLIACHAVGSEGEQQIAGTLFSRHEPHIVQVGPYRLDFCPEGTLLVMQSRDIPGVIGRVGTILGNHQINIAEWRTGRTAPGGEAFSVITLDEAAPDAVLAAIEALPQVRTVRQITL